MTRLRTPQAIEITRFNLAGGLTITDFVRANADVDAWLLCQPGFVSRRISQDLDGAVIDMLIWSSAAQGKAAASRLMSELAHSPVHAAIDQQTVSWTVAPVIHSLPAKTAPSPRRDESHGGAERRG
uniref:ABM domain-containing protein n=1 Tax=Caulobacter sp. (strain K31) TaxID=366602 RepID=B0SVQ5_CAUSK